MKELIQLGGTQEMLYKGGNMDDNLKYQYYT